MGLSNPELVINGFAQLPGGVKQVQDAQQNDPNRPTTDFQKALFQKWHQYLEQSGDVEGAKRGYVMELHQQSGGGGLSSVSGGPAPAPAPTDSGTGLNGATPIPTTVPVQEPPASMATPPPVTPAQLPQHKPLFPAKPAPQQATPPQPSAPMQPVEVSDPSSALDRAAQPLAVRNPALAAAPPPAPPKPQMPVPQTQQDWQSFQQMAPQFSSMENARTAADSRENVANINSTARMALEDYKQGGRVELANMRNELQSKLKNMEQTGQDNRQTRQLAWEADALQARLDAMMSIAQTRALTQQENNALQADLNLFRTMMVYQASVLGSAAKMDPRGIITGDTKPMFDRLQQEAAAGDPQAKAMWEAMQKKYAPQSVTPGATPPAPQQGSSSVTSTTTSTPVAPPNRVMVPGSKAAKQAAQQPTPAPAPQAEAPQQPQNPALEQGAKAAQEAKLPSVPAPQKKTITKKARKPTDKVVVTFTQKGQTPRTKTMTWADAQKFDGKDGFAIADAK